jgi:hypothetical protein
MNVLHIRVYSYVSEYDIYVYTLTHSLHTCGILLELITVIGSVHSSLAGATEHDFAHSPTSVST